MSQIGELQDEINGLEAKIKELKKELKGTQNLVAQKNEVILLISEEKSSLKEKVEQYERTIEECREIIRSYDLASKFAEGEIEGLIKAISVFARILAGEEEE